ncbi:MarR family EPS-associated transcriptional regulator [Azonexus sp.]|uniref:MarR family EPS-associated transcriptional regulator n=1 Tax=Azonexus sp. TaxID=1872668 RepID=UPI0035B47171
MIDRMQAQQEDVRFRILRLLQDNPHLTQRELAETLGISLGKANFCVKALLDKGLIKLHNFKASRNKLAYSYLLTPAGVAEKAALTARFLGRKMAEYEQLKAEIESLKQECDVQPRV